MLFSAFKSLLFSLYRWIISPALHLLSGPGMGCRYTPTCSEYCSQAIDKYGWARGIGLGVKRICRCHPFSSAPPYDPVP